jgi:ionotropic glutamate receptor
MIHRGSGKMIDLCIAAMGVAKRRQVILLLLVFSSGAAQNATVSPAEEFHVGVILDLGSLVGKVALTSISLAVEDFYAACQNCSRKLVLHVRDSMGNDVQAASAGMCSAASHVL